MNISGVITEYNPFHNGHKFHLENCKKDTNSDYIICVMSGNFVQRGEPALLDKWSRAKMALLNGVDLVLELPLVYSLSSAEDFAYGAVKILDACNVVDQLYFGSEDGHIDTLTAISKTLISEPLEYRSLLKDSLSKGLPFHQSRANALQLFLKDPLVSEILNNSNNILGIEYIKALLRLNSNIKPTTLKRLGSNYNDLDLSNSFSSATSIRRHFLENSNLNLLENELPPSSLNILKDLSSKDYIFPKPESIFSYVKYRLLVSKVNFENLRDIGEGLDYKILKEIEKATSFEEFLFNVKSKRYTYTRISRLLTQIFVSQDNFNLDVLKKEALYLRPLAFNMNGAKILKKIKKSSNIPIYTKLPKEIDNLSLNFDIQGTMAYSLICPSISPKEDYLQSPIIIK